MSKQIGKGYNTHAEATISRQECEAMRALDVDMDYTRSEIAFMFECGPDTVARHCDRECGHEMPQPDGPARSRKYDPEDLRAALVAVDGGQPYEQMSAQVYEDYRKDSYPSSWAIIDHYGTWTAAREEVLGDE